MLLKIVIISSYYWVWSFCFVLKPNERAPSNGFNTSVGIFLTIYVCAKLNTDTKREVPSEPGVALAVTTFPSENPTLLHLILLRPSVLSFFIVCVYRSDWSRSHCQNMINSSSHFSSEYCCGSCGAPGCSAGTGAGIGTGAGAGGAATGGDTATVSACSV